MREPIGDGIYYPASKEELKQVILRSPKGTTKDLHVKSGNLWLPYGLYKDVGATCASLYQQVKLPPQVILLAANHTLQGEKFSVLTDGSFRTPLGPIRIQTELASLLMENCPILREDFLAHIEEPALECQLPFIQTLSPTTEFVPLLVQEASWKRVEEISDALVKTIHQFLDAVLLILVTLPLEFHRRSELESLGAKAAYDRLGPYEERTAISIYLRTLERVSA